MLKQVNTLTPEDIARVLRKYVLPCFNPATSLGSIATPFHTRMDGDELRKTFREKGYFHTTVERINPVGWSEYRHGLGGVWQRIVESKMFAHKSKKGGAQSQNR